MNAYIFTAAEASKRIKEKYKPGDAITLPELYGDEWTTDQQVASELGKEFRLYLENGNTSGIRPKGTRDSGHAVYEVYM